MSARGRREILNNTHMQLEQRYQISATIGSGDFATVYRALDVELKREVAIKQIHGQYLQDPRQLDRYWQEAQILANLPHPFIMSIYDIARQRGWMILELMQGSLSGELQGRPIDIETLKIALTQCLHALDYLHARGVLHGDVKPSNLMIGLNRRLKLGDFGLARRANTGEGSLLKGTPKYMAPEVISDQFGPVGPASDLYSLGFTCYELLCGSHFESLFPGLSTFGRDKAVAWMMWHAAPDRRLPEIQKVLDGVPDDIAAVIGRLIVKDPARRYRTAGEVLEELKERPLSPSTSASEAAAEAAAREVKRKRRLAIAALAVSAALSLGLAFLPMGRQPPAALPDAASANNVRSGQIRELLVDEGKLVLVVPEDRRPLEISVPQNCQIRLNGKQFLLLRELSPGDEARVTLAKGASHGLTAEAIDVTRPDSLSGVFRSFDAQRSVLELDVMPDGKSREIRVLQVPPELKPHLNHERRFSGKPVTFELLRPGDRITARYFERDGKRETVAVDAYRVVSLSGKLEQLNLDNRREIKLAAENGEWTIPLAAECTVTLNGEFASPRDLAPGDQVTIEHDVEVKKIEATRAGPK